MTAPSPSRFGRETQSQAWTQGGPGCCLPAARLPGAASCESQPCWAQQDLTPSFQPLCEADPKAERAQGRPANVLASSGETGVVASQSSGLRETACAKCSEQGLAPVQGPCRGCPSTPSEQVGEIGWRAGRKRCINLPGRCPRPHGPQLVEKTGTHPLWTPCPVFFRLY